MWVQIAIAVASLVLSYVLTPKTPKPPKQEAQEFDRPVVEEGKEAPVLFGTRWVRDPNVGWFGDIESVELN